MQQNQNTKSSLEDLQEILETLAREVGLLFRDDSLQVGSWRRSLEAVAESLREETLRIAVVGAVKSGKSTFMNAIQGRDLLKRGAGIVTAFITRVRFGANARGWVEIKSWNEINAEVNEALSMLRFSRSPDGLGAVDLRRDEDRRSLERLLQETRQNGLGGGDTLDANTVVINAYLSGYGALSGHVRDEPVRLEFSEEDLHRHQQFVSQESQAVYLRDMELQVPLSWLGEMVEIGDCQGSDSPNPLHFAMLQEYLLGSHCILYLISGRMGVRQADLKLIEAIKILRLLPQTLFILNVDLDEHGNVESVQQLEDRVGQELRLLVPAARIYAFSALLQLLEALSSGDDLSPRERRRLEGWHEEKVMAEASRRGYEEFCDDLKNLVNRERSRVLYGGVLSHLQRVGQSMQDSVSARKGLLCKDLEELRALVDEIKMRQQSVLAAITTVEHTLDGLRDSLKEKVRSVVDSYFDSKYGPIIRETMDVIENYPVQNFAQSTVEETRRWIANLYLFYRDFRQMLSRHLIEKVNLRIIDFAKSEEEHIQGKLLESAAGYWDILGQALRQYQKTLTDSGLTLGLDTPEALPQPTKPAMAPPPFSAFLERSDGLGRGSLLLRFSMRRLRRLFSGFRGRGLRRDAAERGGTSDRVFLEAVNLVKQEAQKELLEAFKDYRQNLKFAYLFCFIEQYAQALVQVFRDFGEATMVDIGHLQEAAYQKGASQRDVTEDLAIVAQRLGYAADQLRSLERRLGV